MTTKGRRMKIVERSFIVSMPMMLLRPTTRLRQAGARVLGWKQTRNPGLACSRMVGLFECLLPHGSDLRLKARAKKNPKQPPATPTIGLVAAMNLRKGSGCETPNLNSVTSSRAPSVINTPAIVHPSTLAISAFLLIRSCPTPALTRAAPVTSEL